MIDVYLVYYEIKAIDWEEEDSDECQLFRSPEWALHFIRHMADNRELKKILFVDFNGNTHRYAVVFDRKLKLVRESDLPYTIPGLMPGQRD